MLKSRKLGQTNRTISIFSNSFLRRTRFSVPEFSGVCYALSVRSSFYLSFRFSNNLNSNLIFIVLLTTLLIIFLTTIICFLLFYASKIQDNKMSFFCLFYINTRAC